MNQLQKLDALISAACAAREAAMSNMLFASTAGLVLTKAAFDLFECDGLYGIANDVEREIGRVDEGRKGMAA